LRAISWVACPFLPGNNKPRRDVEDNQSAKNKWCLIFTTNRNLKKKLKPELPNIVGLHKHSPGAFHGVPMDPEVEKSS